MSLIKDVLELMRGKVHFYMYVGGSPAVEIILRDREIVADIKNPILAIELGLKQLGNRAKVDSYVLKQIKKAGYKIKVKYKMIEFEL
jgi:peptidyl-tRNA hydrolase